MDAVGRIIDTLFADILFLLRLALLDELSLSKVETSVVRRPTGDQCCYERVRHDHWHS